MRRDNAVHFTVACLAAALWVSASAVGAEPGPPKKVATVEGITEYRLDNGLRVLLFPDPSTPKVTVNMTVFVGSRHEGYGETGMAHLLEHMVFKGTPDHPDIAERHEGARGPVQRLDQLRSHQLLRDAPRHRREPRVRASSSKPTGWSTATSRAEDLSTEMTVVRNEFESGENSPQRVLNQRMMATAFEWHNYGKSTIGNRTDIERVPIDRLQAFYTQVLPARQRRARRRRQVRREEGARPGQQVLRRDPEARANARHDLHRGAARRTASGW